MYADHRAGREVARQWLREMLRGTEGEYPDFIAARLDPLRPRARRRPARNSSCGPSNSQPRSPRPKSTLTDAPAGLPRLFLLEEEYRQALLRAELAWLDGVIADLREGRLTWTEEWLHEIAADLHTHRRPRGSGGQLDDCRRSRPIGLTKQYGKTKALDGLDLIAERGQVTAVLGPNGAGKTTFVRMVATLLRADEGTLLVAGHDARKEPGAVRRVIGLAGQFAAVEPAMTGRENLEMVASLFGQSRRAAKASAAAVLEQLGLVEAGDRLARTYSGGMRRRLDLGASLVGAPRLLLLDEPTTGLDPRSRIELWDAIRALVESGTDVLLTTQYLDEADHLASQIVIIDHGRAVAAGTPAELKQRIGGNVIEVHVRDSRDLAMIAELLGRARRRRRRRSTRPRDG